jgi:hypothetical protein
MQNFFFFFFIKPILYVLPGNLFRKQTILPIQGTPTKPLGQPFHDSHQLKKKSDYEDIFNYIRGVNSILEPCLQYCTVQ